MAVLKAWGLLTLRLYTAPFAPKDLFQSGDEACLWFHYLYQAYAMTSGKRWLQCCYNLYVFNALRGFGLVYGAAMT